MAPPHGLVQRANRHVSAGHGGYSSEWRLLPASVLSTRHVSRARIASRRLFTGVMRRLRTHRQFPRRSKGAGLRTALELILRVRRVALSASNSGFARGPPLEWTTPGGSGVEFVAVDNPYVRGPSSARAAASLLRVTTGLPMLFVEMRGEMACLLRSLGSDGMVSSVASRLPPEATLAIGSRLLLACSSSQDGRKYGRTSCGIGFSQSQSL